MLGDDVEFPGDTLTRDRIVDDRGQALPAEVVDDAQDRKRRPSVSVSETKSRLQRWLAPCGIPIGALVPNARLRPLA